MISVNLTILPLINEDNDGRTGEKDSFLGILLMIEDISSEKRMKSTMSRYMDPGIARPTFRGRIRYYGWIGYHCYFIIF